MFCLKFFPSFCFHKLGMNNLELAHLQKSLSSENIFKRFSFCQLTVEEGLETARPLLELLQPNVRTSPTTDFSEFP